VRLLLPLVLRAPIRERPLAGLPRPLAERKAVAAGSRLVAYRLLEILLARPAEPVGGREPGEVLVQLDARGTLEQRGEVVAALRPGLLREKRLLGECERLVAHRPQDVGAHRLVHLSSFPGTEAPGRGLRRARPPYAIGIHAGGCVVPA